MLTQVTMRSGKLTETGKTLDEVGKKAGAATDTLESLGKPRFSIGQIPPTPVLEPGSVQKA